MKNALGFVIAVCIAAQVHAAPATPRPLPRPAVEDAEQVAVNRPLPRPDVAADTEPLSFVAELSERGDVVVPGASERPRARNGVFVETRVPADSMVDVSRAVVRIHSGALYRPSVRPPHPLGEETLVLTSAVQRVTPGTPEPKLRPAGFFERFRNTFPSTGNYSAKGAVCGVNAIKGTQIASFGNPSRGCGVADPVRVTSVAGIQLSTPATIDCRTAQALNEWVENGIKPAFGRQGGGVVQLTVAAHYACRNRNNRSGGKLSEHAKGHAVDISAITLRDGTSVTVLTGWNSGTWGDEMKQVHRAACGPFGTVLGPLSDGYHKNHFHVDTARYRSGSYCR